MPYYFAIALNGVRIEIEKVDKRQRLKCSACKEKPRKRRLRMTMGSGRFVRSYSHCVDCGQRVLDTLKEVVEDASNSLEHGDTETDLRFHARLVKRKLIPKPERKKKK